MKQTREFSPENQEKFIKILRNKNRDYFSRHGHPPQALVKTYGCQQNKSDSEQILGVLCNLGYSPCQSAKLANIIIFNTCAVRENAENKVFGNVGALKHLKKNNPNVLLGICGCMTQQTHIAREIAENFRHIDFVVGTNAIALLPEIIVNALEKHVVYINEETGPIPENVPTKREKPPIASVAIMRGCDNFCTYCVVPYVRGREKSREPENILMEINELAAAGYKEIMLLGQNVNSYGKNLQNPISFARLLEKICEIDKVERIRFMTSHPKDISLELIRAMARHKKICKQLHLPVQCGSSKILRLMNRNYTLEKYLELVRTIKEEIPEICLTSDIIVGFPGETNDDFEATLDVLRLARFDMIFSFIYSRRAGTPAANMPDCLTDEEKHKNFARLLEVQNEISRQKNEACVGKIFEILVEGPSKTGENMMAGRTDGGKIVNFAGDENLIGEIVPIRITNARTWYLTGEIEK